TGRAPRQRIALTVGDQDDGVVEAGMHVCDAIADVLLGALLLAAARGCHQLSQSLDRSDEGTTSSCRQWAGAAPCGYGRWCACLGRAPAARACGAYPGNSPGQSDA